MRRDGRSDPAKVRAGKAGRAASPWGRSPHCNTQKATRVFSEENRRLMIAEAAARAERIKRGDPP